MKDELHRDLQALAYQMGRLAEERFPRSPATATLLRELPTIIATIERIYDACNQPVTSGESAAWLLGRIAGMIDPISSLVPNLRPKAPKLPKAPNAQEGP